MDHSDFSYYEACVGIACTKHVTYACRSLNPGYTIKHFDRTSCWKNTFDISWTREYKKIGVPDRSWPRDLPYSDRMLSNIIFSFFPQVLKLYAWEQSFLSKIMEIRNDELRYLRNASCFNAVIEFTFTCAPFLVRLPLWTLVIIFPSKE